MSSVVLVARQAGTANAFIPIWRQLRELRPADPPRVLAYPPATTVLSDGGVPFRTIATAQEGLSIISGEAPNVLLTGTSLEAVDDGVWWEWARRTKVRSIAFVDQWVNTARRFGKPADRPGCLRDVPLPDLLAVVDERSVAKFVELGVDPRRVRITSSPAFDTLFEVDIGAVDRLRAELRAKAEGMPIVLFVGEPFVPPDSYDGFKTRFGFDERDVARLLVRQAKDHRFALVFRPHPLHQQIEPAAEVLRLPWLQGDKRVAVLAADLVVGMTSMLLLEASLLGCRVMSLQPGRHLPSDLTDGRPGIEVYTDEVAAARALSELEAADRQPRPIASSGPTYTERFLTVLNLL